MTALINFGTVIGGYAMKMLGDIYRIIREKK